MVMKTELERIDGRRRKRGRPQRPSTVSNRFILTLDSFWFCIFRITYSSPLFPFPSTGGHHTSALAAPVVLTAPDRAVLMGADDDWRPWGELTAHKGHISPHRCRGRDGESERKEEEWRQVDERREGGKKKPLRRSTNEDRQSHGKMWNVKKLWEPQWRGTRRGKTELENRTDRRGRWARRRLPEKREGKTDRIQTWTYRYFISGYTRKWPGPVPSDLVVPPTLPAVGLRLFHYGNDFFPHSYQLVLSVP